MTEIQTSTPAPPPGLSQAAQEAALAAVKPSSVPVTKPGEVTRLIAPSAGGEVADKPDEPRAGDQSFDDLLKSSTLLKFLAQLLGISLDNNNALTGDHVGEATFNGQKGPMGHALSQANGCSNIPLMDLKPDETAGNAVARAAIHELKTGNGGATYSATTGAGAGAAWCASFATTVLKEAGINEVPGSASALGLASQFEHKGALNAFGGGKEAKAGDLIFFTRDHQHVDPGHVPPQGGQGHTGVIVFSGIGPDGQHIVQTVEGNIGNKTVSRTYHDKDLQAGNVVGFGDTEKIAKDNPRFHKVDPVESKIAGHTPAPKSPEQDKSAARG